MNSFIVDTFDVCPMDLKKLEIARKFDLREREEKLLKIFKKLGYEKDEYSPQARQLRNGTKVEAEYVILSKAIER